MSAFLREKKEEEMSLLFFLRERGEMSLLIQGRGKLTVGLSWASI